MVPFTWPPLNDERSILHINTFYLHPKFPSKLLEEFVHELTARSRALRRCPTIIRVVQRTGAAPAVCRGGPGSFWRPTIFSSAPTAISLPHTEPARTPGSKNLRPPVPHRGTEPAREALGPRSARPGRGRTEPAAWRWVRLSRGRGS